MAFMQSLCKACKFSTDILQNVYQNLLPVLKTLSNQSTIIDKNQALLTYQLAF